ncbi:MAG: PhoH family protein [Candidatus Omnitrophica bacterium]|nr:PhoH family protein [Candidatus Omnitrophota bacterium]
MDKVIRLSTDEEAIKLYGSLDENLRHAEESFKVKIYARNNRLTISGEDDDVARAAQFFNDQLAEIRHEGRPAPAEREAQPAESGQTHSGPGRHDFFHKGKMIRPKSKNQEDYIAAVKENDIVFGIGPAGTGKTYLAVALALEHLKKKKVNRIILTRPAVEAGESLGFLPGDLYAKINPYLRPLYDALYDMMDMDEVVRSMQRGIIEIAPLAYMRGRTLNDAFVILDEGQNTTPEQMKMFLTRLGFSSKAVITGDVTQIDLPSGKRSGLVESQKILHDIHGIRYVYLTEKDVVRHRLVKDIVKAYEKHAHQKEKESGSN